MNHWNWNDEEWDWNGGIEERKTKFVMFFTYVKRKAKSDGNLGLFEPST